MTGVPGALPAIVRDNPHIVCADTFGNEQMTHLVQLSWRSWSRNYARTGVKLPLAPVLGPYQHLLYEC